MLCHLGVHTLSGGRKSNPPNQYVNEISSGREKGTEEEVSGVGGRSDKGAAWVRAGRAGFTEKVI